MGELMVSDEYLYIVKYIIMIVCGNFRKYYIENKTEAFLCVRGGTFTRNSREATNKGKEMSSNILIAHPI